MISLGFGLIKLLRRIHSLDLLGYVVESCCAVVKRRDQDRKLKGSTPTSTKLCVIEQGTLTILLRAGFYSGRPARKCPRGCRQYLKIMTICLPSCLIFQVTCLLLIVSSTSASRRRWSSGSYPTRSSCQAKVITTISVFTRFNITKTRLFKYIENFKPQKENFQIKILIFVIFLLKT